MTGLGNKEIFSSNLKKYIEISGKDRKDIAKDLSFSYSTFTDWINGNTYPRIDRIEKLANYFNISKSDLIEEHKEEYYLNGETRQIAQEIKDNPELRALFDASRNATPEDLEITRDLILSLKRKEQGRTDWYGKCPILAITLQSESCIN